jgi:hypothetical protein
VNWLVQSSSSFRYSRTVSVKSRCFGLLIATGATLAITAASAACPLVHLSRHPGIYNPFAFTLPDGAAPTQHLEWARKWCRSLQPPMLENRQSVRGQLAERATVPASQLAFLLFADLQGLQQAFRRGCQLFFFLPTLTLLLHFTPDTVQRNNGRRKCVRCIKSSWASKGQTSSKYSILYGCACRLIDCGANRTSRGFLDILSGIWSKN